MAGKNARKELSEQQLAYIVWAATPDELREPATQEDFARALGIARQSIWRWSKDPRVLDAIRFIVLQNAGDPRRVNQVLDMVFTMALKGEGNLKAAELWMRAVGLSSQFTRTNVILDALDDDASFADFSTEELEALKKEAEAMEAEQVTINRARETLVAHGVDPQAIEGA